MAVNTAEIRRRLAAFDFPGLLIEELGWNLYRSAPLELLVDGVRYSLKAAAEKCGLVVYECGPGPDRDIPTYPMRRKIERQVAKIAHEHLIVFVDAARKNQLWQWVRRQTGQPIRYRELAWRAGQTNESLVQTLPSIAFELEEEERLTIVDVASRVQQQVNERVTKRFFDRFQAEHKGFLKFIEGIKGVADREWYASLMLNRLMFIYFIQRKGFLDDDRDYLRNRLSRMQQGLGRGHFHRFYRLFLLRLFHEGLGQPEANRSPELAALLGKVPYLNGGLFDVHDLERNNPDIQIPDVAFETIFAFFDAYHWHLDERPLRADNEINPDVLGYIFEKYINQKQMGAYYTKEDITGYISRNTVIPFLLETARKHCPIAFATDGGVWRLLRNDPDRYIYEPLRKGLDLDLPPEVAAGLNDTSSRGAWNRTASENLALPNETWREHIERRQRISELRRRLQSGETNTIDDLITLNLDLERFALDAVSQSEGPELVRAFWSALRDISVLDPACGSGAFLFATLNILETLYSACADSMQGFVDDLERTERKHHPNALKPFRDALDQIAHHPNRRYFILKSIVVGNLYGVDIMEEAVEICKLRLFLKLVAQLDAPEQIEPLPDIDFNIRAGNTLVGFTSLQEVRASQANRLGFTPEELARIDEEAEIADRAFQQFRDQQTQQHLDASAFTNAKAELRRRLKDLRTELDRYLAGQYGIKVGNNGSVNTWREKERPFHWFVEFYGIMRQGGFDVVIGNPPYRDLRDVEYEFQGYATTETGNLYAPMLERAFALGHAQGREGFIVPVSSISTDGYLPLQRLLTRRRLHFSSYDDRPSRLFDGLEHIRLTIHVMGPVAATAALNSTRYHKWSKVERDLLFERLTYAESAPLLIKGTLPKLSSPLEREIIDKLAGEKKPLALAYARQGPPLYYSRKLGYFLQVLDFEPRVLDGQGNRRPPSEFKTIRFTSEKHRDAALCLLSSSLFYWFVTVFSDCRHLNKREIDGFPLDLAKLSNKYSARLSKLARKLMRNLDDTSEEREMQFRHDRLTIQCIMPRFSKPILDEIDAVLAEYYGFSPFHLDFIVNYDIKYRVGQSDEDDGD